MRRQDDLVHHRVLVTGGAGFIGSHLADAQVAAGAETTVIDDLSGGDRANVPAGARFIEADVADEAVIALVAELGPDLVIHAAAQVSVPTSMADPGRDRAVNLIGTANVLEGARRCGARRFVFVSSGGAIYGEATLATEDALPVPASYYGIHKLAAEGYVRVSGLPYGIVRYANVYGPRQRAEVDGGVVAIFCERLRSGRRVTLSGTGEQTRDLIHVDDVVRGTLAVAGAPTSGTWNIATGRSTSILELLELLQTLIGRATSFEQLPDRPGDVFASSLAIDKAATELGWRPRLELRDGLQALLTSATA